MRELLALLAHLMVTSARLLGPGGVKGVVAESLLLKHQLLIINQPAEASPQPLRFSAAAPWVLVVVSASASGFT
jgi:hypothetical protein